MPMPSQSDLHVNVPLTNVSIAYMQDAGTYIADKIFPRVPVQKQSDLYWKYSKSDWRRTDVERRAPSTESPGSGWNNDSDSYFCHVYAVHKDIDDQLRANADSVFNMDRDATQFITNQMLIKRDLDWNARFFKAGVWATEVEGGTGKDFAKWDEGDSDPIGYMAQLIIDFRKRTGFAPNIMVLGAKVMKALKNHPDILDRIKWTQKGIVTEDLIATLFQIPELYTSYATYTTQPQLTDARAQDAAAEFEFLTDPENALVAYAPKSPSTMTPSAGYTFTWKGYLGGNSQGIRISRFRMDTIKSDRIEAEMTYDMKVVCPDMGVFMKNVVS